METIVDHPMQDVPRWQAALNVFADKFQPEWVAMRRHLHQHPELSGAEQATTAYLAAALTKLGMPPQIASDGCGVTANFATSTAPSRWIAIRGDIDALPITDAKSVDYRSRCDGVMHACGHDVHATIVVGAMQLLGALDASGDLPWPIAVRAILQPAEELATGARHMIQQHALRDVDAILALHVDPTRSVGSIGLRYGTLTAACDLVHVQFIGRGGHGARPHLTHDPIDAATRWVQSAFRRLSRTVNPHETVVFSVGQINAGHSANVIPDSAKLSGSLRSLDPQSRRVALETLENVCEAVRIETGCHAEMKLGFSAPAVINNESLIHLLEQAVSQSVGRGAIEWIDQPSMGSEDFSYYLEHVPGAMFRLGVAGDQVGHETLHTSTFDIDERGIAIGAKVFAAAVIDYFDPQRV